MIDGCGALRTFVQVMLPLAKSAFITVLLFSFVWHWNDYVQAAMYFNDNQPISVMLNQMQSLLQDAKLFNVVTNTPDEIRTYLQAGCLLTILPPLVLTVSGADADWGTWVYRALTFLVISCPCALVISIPLGYFGGIGAASKKGILVKGGHVLDALHNIKTVAFDKTGTLHVI